MIAVAIVALAAFALIAWLGAGKAIERFSKTRLGDVTLSRRASMFQGAQHIFFDHPVKGIGLGTIISVFPRYDTGYDGLVVDHVHNDYIEALGRNRTAGRLVRTGVPLVAVSRSPKFFHRRTGTFLPRASRRRDCRCLRALASQFRRFQPPHPFERHPISVDGPSRDVGASCFGRFNASPAHTEARTGIRGTRRTVTWAQWPPISPNWRLKAHG